MTDATTQPTDRDLALDMAERLVRQFEGFRANPYKDQGGTWTIGYGTISSSGHVINAQTPPITMDEADALMRAELHPTFDAVNASIRVPVGIWVRAALTSFAYNEGIGAERSSSALAFLNHGDTDGAAEALKLWNKVRVNGVLVVSQGLVRRRAVEAAVLRGEMVP